MKSYKTGAGSSDEENKKTFRCSDSLFNVSIYFIETETVSGSVSHFIRFYGRLINPISSFLYVGKTDKKGLLERKVLVDAAFSLLLSLSL